MLAILANDGFVVGDEGHYEGRVCVHDWNGIRLPALSQAEYDAKVAADDEWLRAREAPG
jgi:hypothetical protein